MKTLILAVVVVLYGISVRFSIKEDITLLVDKKLSKMKYTESLKRDTVLFKTEDDNLRISKQLPLSGGVNVQIYVKGILAASYFYKQNFRSKLSFYNGFSKKSIVKILSSL